MASKGKERPRKVGPSVFEKAKYRGVMPVRRFIHPTSAEALTADVSDILADEMYGSARVYDAKTLGITVVGFSRFTNEHRLIGPATANIARQRVPSATKPIEATLGHFTVVGSGGNHKLAAELVSPELIEEEQAFVTAFNETGFPVLPEINAEDGRYHPHLSLAALYKEHVEHHKDPQAIARLEAIVEPLGHTVLLNPVEFR